MKEIATGHDCRNFNLRRIIEVLSMFSTDMNHLVWTNSSCHTFSPFQWIFHFRISTHKQKKKSRESHDFCNMHYILLTICKMCQLLKRTIANREDVLNYVCMPWFWLNHLENEFSNVVQICHCWNHILAFILFVGCVMCKHTHTLAHGSSSYYRFTPA